jgi:4,5-DOPA dioxygenase extradiol
MPTLFVSHGSPMFALEPGQAGPVLQALGASLPRPQAIAVISPHWMTRGAAVCLADPPQTIHDFGGFDPHLYQMQYPASKLGLAGMKSAQLAMNLIANSGWPVVSTTQWGLDHGAWVPLSYLFPQGDVPVFQISLPAHLSPQQAFDYGCALGGLREQGVLVIGSGSLTHNLGEFRPGLKADTPVQDYVREFVDWVRDAVAHGDAEKLIRTFELAPHAQRAHPTNEHYLPLLVALGAAQRPEEKVTGRLVGGGITYGILSMDSFIFGPDGRN